MKTSALLLGTLALSLLTACEGDKPAPALAPSASKLEAPAAKTSGAATFVIKKDGSQVRFTMEAPIEQILGKLDGASTGEVKVDVSDLTKSTALLSADLGSLVLTQKRKEKAEDAAFGEEKKEDKQNEHARAWLEISDESPNKEANRKVELTVTSVKTDTPDVTKLTGDERKVKATIGGDFLLHGRKTPKTVEVEVTFRFKDGKPVSMRVATTKPFTVGLEEHDVKPRDTVGKLLEKTLSAMSEKVAKEAQVSIDFTTELDGAAKANAPAVPSPAVPSPAVPSPAVPSPAVPSPAV
ncbi:MAG: hypothetical protein FJ096_05945, partial [Deltaproteobacteria bacterium]|nr:hypothetical protein [Deltaproteobacteria bacterium]